MFQCLEPVYMSISGTVIPWTDVRPPLRVRGLFERGGGWLPREGATAFRNPQTRRRRARCKLPRSFPAIPAPPHPHARPRPRGRPLLARALPVHGRRDIRRSESAPAGKGKRKTKYATASLKAVREMRPERDEIIICTDLSIKGSGVQYWGCRATSLFVQRRQRG